MEEQGKEVARARGAEAKRESCAGAWGAGLGNRSWQLGAWGTYRRLGNQNGNNKKEEDMECR